MGPQEYIIVVVGAQGVGKSAITLQFTQHHFVEEYYPTVEDAYKPHYNIDENVCFMNIYDSVDYPEYLRERTQAIEKGEGFIVVYSICSRESFESVAELYTEILTKKQVDKIPMVLVGNKKDLDEERAVTSPEAQNLANTKLHCPFFETSAKIHSDTKKVFYEIVREIRRANQPDAPIPTKAKCFLQ